MLSFSKLRDTRPIFFMVTVERSGAKVLTKFIASHSELDMIPEITMSDSGWERLRNPSNFVGMRNSGRRSINNNQ